MATVVHGWRHHVLVVVVSTSLVFEFVAQQLLQILHVFVVVSQLIDPYALLSTLEVINVFR